MSAHPAMAGVLARLSRLRHLTWDEVSGSVGDMGTFIPLVIGVCIHNNINFASTLFFAGLLNFITGLTFDVPMPVQPMKAIAAIALSSDLSVNEILAGGIMTSAAVFVLGITGWIDVCSRIVPRPVIRGLQVGLGFTLIKTGVGYIAINTDGELCPWHQLLLGSLLFLASFLQGKRFPFALVLFIGGCVYAAVDYSNPHTHDRAYSNGYKLFWPSAVTNFTGKDFVSGTLNAALPQLPITVLNSVVAVCSLSHDLVSNFSI
jgi:predicted benzoate:H+ symporter BenE